MVKNKPQSNDPSTKEEQLVLEENQQILRIAEGISESVRLIAESYQRRAKKNLLDVNLPAGAGQSETPNFLQQLPTPFKDEDIIKKMLKATIGKMLKAPIGETEEEYLNKLLIESTRQQRQRNEEHGDDMARQAKVIQVPVYRDVVRGTSDRGAENRGVGERDKTAVSNTRGAGATVPNPYLVEQPVVVDLEQYPPLMQIKSALDELMRTAEYRKIPHYLDPIPLHLTLVYEFKWNPIVYVPRSEVANFVNEVRSKGAISNMARGLITLLRKRISVIELAPQITAPEGGSSIRV